MKNTTRNEKEKYFSLVKNVFNEINPLMDNAESVSIKIGKKTIDFSMDEILNIMNLREQEDF